MRIPKTLAWAVLATLACGLTWSALRAQTTRPATPARGGTVGVCNIFEVFREYDRAKENLEEMKQRDQQIEEETEKRRRQLEVMQDELRMLTEGSAAFESKFKDITRKRFEIEGFAKMQRALAQRDHMVLTDEMDKEISTAVRAVADRRGIDLVVTPDVTTGTEEGERVNPIARIGRRSVLWWSEQVDITDEVVGYLNETYRQKKVGARR
jgi:Skp family chaperone for outer membrane proteins